jgi:hypothetical protein
MHIVKLLSIFFLALYLVIVGLVGLGFSLAFVPPGLVGFFALAAGVLFFVWGIKSCYCCKDDHCCVKHDHDHDVKS